MIPSDDSEAMHMAEIEDGMEVVHEPYTEEKLAYVKRRMHSFTDAQVGKYIVTKDSKRPECPCLYLVDRRKTRSMWWSPYAGLAMVFDHKEAALHTASRLKHGKVSVRRIGHGMTGTKA